MGWNKTKAPKEPGDRPSRAARRAALYRGGYLAAVTALAVALVIVINLIAGQLPSHIREFDLTDNSLYEVSETSQTFLSELDKDVEIVILAEEGATDQRILKFLEHYAALSSHITVTEVDPVAHPAEAAAYEAESNSLVVLCEETGKQEVISFNDIIVYGYDSSYYYYGEQSFDAEGQLTSALDYVTNDAGKKVYTVTGHGESDLSATITDAIDKANFSLDAVSPALNGGVPEDCDLLIANGPTTDLSESERELLEAYLDGGGQMILLLPEDYVDLPNWDALMNRFNLDMVEGYIADTSRYYPQLGSPFAICATLDLSSPITSALSSDTLTLLTNSQGFVELTEGADESVTVTPFMTTTSDGYAVTLEGSQTQGTYLLGAVAERTGEDGETTGRLTVFGSTSFVAEDILAANPSIANQTIFMNAVTGGFDDVTNLSIPAKSLSVAYNTIANPNLWSSLYIIVLPIGILAAGLIFWTRRRKR